VSTLAVPRIGTGRPAVPGYDAPRREIDCVLGTWVHIDTHLSGKRVMSTRDAGSEADSVPEAYGDFPEYELSCAVDDEAGIGEVTVFPGEESDDVCTRWISVDLEHAVPLEETL
jgi:hypothetical protein